MSASFIGQVLPLGAPLGDSQLAVSSQFPTLSDIRAYGEKDPDFLAKLKTGYPRFFENPFVRKVRELQAKVDQTDSESMVLLNALPHPQSFELWWNHQTGDASLPEFSVEKNFVIGRTSPKLRPILWKYCQHFGGGLNPRLAKSILEEDSAHYAVGKKDIFCEELRRALVKQIPALKKADLSFFSSGMSAISESLNAIHSGHQPKTKIWAQVGWLYTDTMKLLNLFSGFKEEDHHLQFTRVPKADELLRKLEFQREHLAGLFLEYPTNPMLESVDLPTLSDWCRRHHIPLIVDVSLQSPWIFDHWDHADLVLSSLTKYAGWSGDCFGGVIIVPEKSHLSKTVRGELHHSPQRLPTVESQHFLKVLPSAPEKIKLMANNAARLVNALRLHPGVDQVFYPELDDAKGGVFSFTLRGRLEPFYDSLKMAKGPSFGTSFSNVCPYLHLSHFDITKTKEGREKLHQIGIPPDLIRFSAGTESYNDIWSVLCEALDAQ